MEQQTAARRISMLLGHLAAAADAPSLHLAPMICSSTLNSTVGRCDNRLLFARQGSAYQAYHMKQRSMRQQKSQASCGTQEKKPQNFQGCNSSQKNSREPMFSRQVQDIPQFQNTRTDLPRFSRRNQKDVAPLSNGKTEWAPRMDAVDMGRVYTLTVELAGVKVSDIQVELDDNNLTIMGQRSVFNSMNGTGASVQQREISQGPFRLLWPLPKNVNKDAVSARFMNGILYVTLPKL